MKLVTWNVNGIRAAGPKGFFAFLESEKPDFLCIQESKAHPDQLPEEYLRPTGYKSVWSPSKRKGYSGTGIYFSETLKTNVKPLDMGIGVRVFDDEGRVCRLQTPEFELINIYFPNGGASQERHDFKQEFLLQLLYWLQKKIKAQEPMIVVGDYNVAYLEHDVYDPKALSTESGFLPEERAWMKAFLELGFVDAYRALHPDANERYTWWSYKENARMRNWGWRIDHICLTKKLSSRLKAAEILDGTLGSDHCPVVVELYD